MWQPKPTVPVCQPGQKEITQQRLRALVHTTLSPYQHESDTFKATVWQKCVMAIIYLTHLVCLKFRIKHRENKHLAKNQGNSNYCSWVLSCTTVEKHCYSCGNRETAEILSVCTDMSRITVCLFLNAIHTAQQFRTCDVFFRSSSAKSICGASIKHSNHLSSDYCNSLNQSKPNTVNQVFCLYTPSVYPSDGVYGI